MTLVISIPIACLSDLPMQNIIRTYKTLKNTTLNVKSIDDACLFESEIFVKQDIRG